MEKVKAEFSRPIQVVFLVILVLGIGMSALVYERGQRISNITLELIESQIPDFELLQRFSTELIRQERYLYEYYTTQDPKHFQVGYLSSKEKSQEIFSQLLLRFEDSEALQETQKDLNFMGQTANDFQNNLAGSVDWDLARNQLRDFSAYRRHISPNIDGLHAQASAELVQSRSQIEEQSNTVRLLVLVYGAATILIAFLVAKVARSAMLKSVESTRLALFPMRNPNPVMSINSANEVVFANPATEKLMRRLNMDMSCYHDILPPDLQKYKDHVCMTDQFSTNFEYTVGNTVLRYDLHWLPDQKQWDMHIVDVTAQKEAEGKLSFQAFHHPETGLSNQYELREKLRNLCAETNEFNLVIAQVKGYGKLVSSRGFEAAQKVVTQLGETLKGSLGLHSKQEVNLFHIGDQNFVFLVFGHNANEVTLTYIRDIEISINDSIYHSQHQPEMEFGITRFPDHGVNVDVLMQNARLAIDAIDRVQEQKYRFYDHNLGDATKREHSLIDEMRAAISNNEFELHMQPQVDINSHNMIGGEVLIRWPRESGWVSPAEFIPIAERSGLIIPLGEWILKTACEQTKKLIDAGHKDIVIAINISPRQFSRHNFLDSVRDVLHSTDLPPENLELEITEGVIMQNENAVIEKLGALKDLGVKLAIDDFGTGYSSLSYLKRFPVDKLKIDQSFVRNMHEDDDDQAIVKTIVDLGKNLNLTLIAEGVEEQSHWDILANMGCDEVQGYFYSKPLPFSEFLEFANQQAEKKHQA